MDNKVKSILTSTLALTVIGAVCAAALAGTNLLTKDRIAERQAAKDEAARQAVLTAEAFEEATLTNETGETVEYYIGKDADGHVVGYVFSATTHGKNSGLVVMTGMDADGTISGVEITENSETAGYVDKVVKGGLVDAMVGQSDISGVDKVSQATKTSAGVKEGVRIALSYYEIITEGGEADE